MIDNSGHHRGNSTEALLDKTAILAVLNIRPGQVLLEAGCGNGYMAKEFLRLTGAAGFVYAVDRSEIAIELLKKEKNGDNFRALQADITQCIELPDFSIDIIYLSAVYHIFTAEQKNKFNEIVSRLLKPGGNLAVVDIQKIATRFGPPLARRVSPEELSREISLTPVSLTRAGESFYLQIFKKEQI
jgi:ubiquinone/menaquinone biosynthesis C-methylase UbiE